MIRATTTLRLTVTTASSRLAHAAVLTLSLLLLLATTTPVVEAAYEFQTITDNTETWDKEWKAQTDGNTLIVKIMPSNPDVPLVISINRGLVLNTIFWIETPLTYPSSSSFPLSPSSGLPYGKLRLTIDSVTFYDSMVRIRRLEPGPEEAEGGGGEGPRYNITFSQSNIVQRSSYFDTNVTGNMLPNHASGSAGYCEPAISVFYFQAEVAGSYKIELHDLSIKLMEHQYDAASTRQYGDNVFIWGPEVNRFAERYGVIDKSGGARDAGWNGVGYVTPLGAPRTMAVAYFCTPLEIRGQIILRNMDINVSTTSHMRNVGVYGFASPTAATTTFPSVGKGGSLTITALSSVLRNGCVFYATPEVCTGEVADPTTTNTSLIFIATLPSSKNTGITVPAQDTAVLSRSADARATQIVVSAGGFLGTYDMSSVMAPRGTLFAGVTNGLVMDDASVVNKFSGMSITTWPAWSSTSPSTVGVLPPMTLTNGASVIVSNNEFIGFPIYIIAAGTTASGGSSILVCSSKVDGTSIRLPDARIVAPGVVVDRCPLTRTVEVPISADATSEETDEPPTSEVSGIDTEVSESTVADLSSAGTDSAPSAVGPSVTDDGATTTPPLPSSPTPLSPSSSSPLTTTTASTDATTTAEAVMTAAPPPITVSDDDTDKYANKTIASEGTNVGIYVVAVGALPGTVAGGADALLSLQLLAMFVMVACSIPGTNQGGMESLLTPLRLDTLGRYEGFVGQIIIIAAAYALYGIVIVGLALVVGGDAASSASEGDAVPLEGNGGGDQNSNDGEANAHQQHAQTPRRAVRRNRWQRAKDLVKHPRAIPFVHQMTFTGLLYESCMLLYGGGGGSSNADAGERVVGAIGIVVSVASIGAYYFIAVRAARVDSAAAEVVKAQVLAEEEEELRSAGGGGGPSRGGGAGVAEEDERPLYYSPRDDGEVANASDYDFDDGQHNNNTANGNNGNHRAAGDSSSSFAPPAATTHPANSGGAAMMYRTRSSRRSAAGSPIGGGGGNNSRSGAATATTMVAVGRTGGGTFTDIEALRRKKNRILAADENAFWVEKARPYHESIASAVPQPFRYLLVPVERWSREVLLSDRCVFAATLKPRNYPLTVAHQLVRGLVVTIVCAVPVSHDYECIIVMCVAALACLLHAAFIAYTRCFRVPVNNFLQGAQSFVLGVIALVRAGTVESFYNDDAVAAVVTAFTVVLIVLTACNVVSSVGSTFIEMCVIGPRLNKILAEEEAEEEEMAMRLREQQQRRNGGGDVDLYSQDGSDIPHKPSNAKGQQQHQQGGPSVIVNDELLHLAASGGGDPTTSPTPIVVDPTNIRTARNGPTAAAAVTPAAWYATSDEDEGTNNGQQQRGGNTAAAANGGGIRSTPSSTPTITTTPPPPGATYTSSPAKRGSGVVLGSGSVTPTTAALALSAMANGDGEGDDGGAPATRHHGNTMHPSNTTTTTELLAFDRMIVPTGATPMEGILSPPPVPVPGPNGAGGYSPSSSFQRAGQGIGLASSSGRGGGSPAAAGGGAMMVVGNNSLVGNPHHVFEGSAGRA